MLKMAELWVRQAASALREFSPTRGPTPTHILSSRAGAAPRVSHIPHPQSERTLWLCVASLHDTGAFCFPTLPLTHPANKRTEKDVAW